MLESEDIKDGITICENVHSAVSGSETKKVQFFRRGKTLNMYVNIRLNSAVAQYTTLFKLPEKFVPIIPYMTQNESSVYVNPDLRTVSVQQSVPANTWIMFSCEWQLK